MWFLALHLPYAYLTFPAALPELTRIAFVGAAAFLGIHIISLRKRAEERLRESEEQFRSIFEQAAVGIAQVAPDGRWLRLNQRLCDIVGYTREGLLTKSFQDITHPDDLENDAANLRRMLVNEIQTYATEKRYIRKDGSSVWVNLTLSLVREPTGAPRCFVSVIEDITKRKRAEHQMQALMESMPDGVLVVNAEGNIVVANAQIESLFGYRRQELLGQPSEMLLPERVRAIHPKHRDGYLAAPETRMMGSGLELYARRKDGSEFPVDISLSAMETEHGRTAISIIRDITERKRAEESLRQRLAELEALHTVSAALRTTQTRDEALPILLDKTLAALETDAGAISLYHADSGELISAVDRGWFAQLDRRPGKPDEGIGGRVFTTGQTHLSAEFQTDPLTRASLREQTPPGWGGACVSIRTGAIMVGVLYVSVPLPRQITTQQVKLLESLAEMAGAALHRMRLYEETVRHLDQLQALHRIDQAIAASMDLPMTLNILLNQVTAQLNVDAASILLLHPHRQVLEYTAGRGFRTDTLQHTRLRLGEGYAGRAALQRKLIYIPELRGRNTDFLRSPYFSAEGFVAYYSVPLIAKGQVKGVLEVFHRAPLASGPDWVSFLETLAGQAAIAVDNAQLFDNLQRSNVDLALAYDATIEGWSRALDLRDRETEGHTLRVTEITMRLAKAIDIGEAELVRVRRGALLHDIGKMGVPDNILLKPGTLTDDEWAIMRQHPQQAHDMLSPIAYLRLALDIPYCHHEKWDGTGYPRGLKGEQIPLAARIFAVVDVYDALRSDRPYRAAWPEDTVREHIRSLAGTHFDPEVVVVFLQTIGEL